MAFSNSSTVLRRALAVVAALVVVYVGSVAVAAPSQDDVNDAFSRAKQLLEEVRGAQAELETLDSRLSEAAQRVQEQEGEVERITTELETAQGALAQLESKLARVSEQLNDRAAEAYMDGPASMIEVVLGSSTMGDLSDRLAFVDVIAQQNADLASYVTNARNRMETKAQELAVLRSQEREALAQIRADEAALREDMLRQQALIAEIERKEAEAARYAKKLDDERQQYLDSLVPVIQPATSSGGGVGPLPPGSSVFRACPVDVPKVVTDSFGAPRYVGGYHPHKGDDIMAPEGTPIRAPFDGYARDATNSIGGIAVIVDGTSGYVYNAHMSRIGQLGSVQAGTVIGYVGMTGASGAGVNHNHFEYHPNTLPTSWPESAYGYSIIDDAVNPYPLLQQVC